MNDDENTRPTPNLKSANEILPIISKACVAYAYHS